MVCKEMGVGAIQMAPTTTGRLVFNDFVRTHELCIGCGSCANICPTGNVWIKDEGDVRKIYCCGSLIKEFKLEHCEQCGKPFASKEYLDFLKKRLKGPKTMGARGVMCEDLRPAVLGETNGGGKIKVSARQTIVVLLSRTVCFCQEERPGLSSSSS